ncbi:unnamed protein product, partial [Scytosiphon promiscuus]
MALSWAQSKVDRFEEKATGSSLGPGDYDPCLPKSQGMAGAVSLGFTSTKGLRAKDREEPMPEETESILNAARDRTSMLNATVSKRSTFGCSSRPSLVVGPSRLEKVKTEQQAKQLAWAESERVKLQAEVKTLRSLQGSLAKSERQARSESVTASKRAEVAERKAATAIADAGRLEAAEAAASRLTGEAAAATLAAEKAEVARDTLQRRREELASRVECLEKRIDELVKTKAELEFQMGEAKKREDALGESVAELRAAKDASEERLREVQAAADASAAAAEEAAERAESVTNELAAATDRETSLDARSARLESELHAREQELQGSEASHGGLREEATALRREGENLAARLGRAEAELEASTSAKSALEEALSEERAGAKTLGEELGVAKKRLAVAESVAVSLEERLGASEGEARRLARELSEAACRLEAERRSFRALERTAAEAAEDADSLRQRLGDALAEGVEYADQHTRVEEKLRSSEADCAALWEEREEAKERLCAAFKEAMLSVAAREAEETGDELSASRAEVEAAKEELERVSHSFATVSSEARVLKASAEDAKAEIARLNGLVADTGARLTSSVGEEERLKTALASSEALREAAAAELAGARASINTGAGDYVALEEKLREAESTSERLRSGSNRTPLPSPARPTTGDGGTSADAAGARRRSPEGHRPAGEARYLREQPDRRRGGGALAEATQEAAALREKLEASRKGAAALEEAVAEALRMSAMMDGIEADHLAGSRTVEELTKGMADIHGIGAELGEKLITMISEKNAMIGKLEVAEGALAASLAHRRRLERDLDASESLVKGLREEKDKSGREVLDLQKEIERLNEAGEFQAAGAMVMLEESQAKEAEAAARIELIEAKACRDVAVAKKEARQAKSELEAASAEMAELRALTEGMCRVQAEGGKAIREAGLAKRNVQRLASENAALAGHNNNKQKIKHLQDLKKQSIRLQNETARQASDLALAVSVLEAVGVLPKEVGEKKESRNARQSGKALFQRRPSDANSVSPSRSHKQTGADQAAGAQKGRSKPRVLTRGRTLSTEDGSLASTPRSKSQAPLVSLQDRLLAALDRAELPKLQQRRAAPKKPHTTAFARGRSQTLPWGPGGTPTGCFPSIKCFGGAASDGGDFGVEGAAGAATACDAE